MKDMIKYIVFVIVFLALTGCLPKSGIQIIEQISPKDGMKLVYVEKGEFQMGSLKGRFNEQPVHTVFLDAFWIDQTEVTNEMYSKCVSAGNCQAPHQFKSSTRESYYGNSQFAHYPVIYVDWNQADSYCKWAGRKLPTEAQWEKAARSNDERTYPWGEGIDHQKANYDSKDTTRVGSYTSSGSPYGALDMAGNVWEWVADRYGERYYDNSPNRNPLGPTSGSLGSLMVVRGGSWFDDETFVRSSHRNWGDPEGSDTDGFRCSMIAIPLN